MAKRVKPASGRERYPLPDKTIISGLGTLGFTRGSHSIDERGRTDIFNLYDGIGVVIAVSYGGGDKGITELCAWAVPPDQKVNPDGMTGVPYHSNNPTQLYVTHESDAPPITPDQVIAVARAYRVALDERILEKELQTFC